MRKLITVVFLLSAFAVFGQGEDCYPQKPRGLVADQEDIFTPQQEQALEAQLQRFSNETSNQIVVVVHSQTLRRRCSDDRYQNRREMGCWSERLG